LSASCSSDVLPEEIVPSTHWIGSCEDYIAALDVAGKRKIET
jgi:hypothetical protein